MPELPEVETTLRGLLPYLTNQLIYSLTLRRRTLRWDIPSHIESRLPGHRITTVCRRAKYLLIDTNAGEVSSSTLACPVLCAYWRQKRLYAHTIMWTLC